MHYAIIAAGHGSRLSSEGVATPKPLVKLRGKPLIKRLIDMFTANDAESIHIITNPAMTEVTQYLREISGTIGVPLHVTALATPSSMHSLEALHLGSLGGKVCVTTVDTVMRADDFSAYISAFRADSSSDAFMAVTPYIDDEKPLYIEVDTLTMDITAFLDSTPSDPHYVSGGVYGLTPAAFDTLSRCVAAGESRMRSFQRALVKSGLRVKAFPISKIVDVDHASDIAEAEKVIDHDPYIIS